jgi:acetyl esterase/lipase
MLDAKLKAAGVSSKLVIVKNGEHGLMSLNGDPTVPSQAEISQTILDFLNTNLMK